MKGHGAALIHDVVLLVMLYKTTAPLLRNSSETALPNEGITEVLHSP